MRRKKIRSYLAAALFFAFLTLSVSLVQATRPLSNQEVEVIETLVQVGKYRLNFQVIEGGNLTILLEAGGGMDSREWNKIAPELARKTGATVVSYDRAGFGKSDLPETPHDMREEVEWLWEGLRKLNQDKNLILVGHSFGGWMIRLFASEHPEAIQGMVFVDPFTNEFVDLLGVEYLDNHPMAGKIPFDTSHPDKLSKYQRALVRMVGDGTSPKIETMRKTSIPSGIPVLVITSGKPFLPKTEEQEAWRLSHEQMTASIKGATLIVAEESDHMVPGRQPDLIIEAVMKVIQKEDQSMGDIIMSLENGAMERWRKGDVWGWTEISADEIIYMDPGLTKPIEGLEAYREYLKQFEGKIDFQISEFIDPKIKRYGDLAVLAYNYRDAKTDPDGSIVEESHWNSTEVYCLIGGEWKIVHTHWSYINHKLPEQTEVPVLIRQPKNEYSGILAELMALESVAMERWRKGDPWGFTDISAQEVTYFNTGTPKRLDGLEALKAEYAKLVGKIRYDVMEFIDPKVRVYGDAAVLFYRFFSTFLNSDGSIARRIPSNCTKVFSKVDGKWKIIHTHWSFINGLSL